MASHVLIRSRKLAPRTQQPKEVILTNVKVMLYFGSRPTIRMVQTVYACDYPPSGKPQRRRYAGIASITLHRSNNMRDLREYSGHEIRHRTSRMYKTRLEGSEPTQIHVHKRQNQTYKSVFRNHFPLILSND